MKKFSKNKKYFFKWDSRCPIWVVKSFHNTQKGGY